MRLESYSAVSARATSSEAVSPDSQSAIPAEQVAEIHLAGFEARGPCLIDTHGSRGAPPVWALYRDAIDRFGPKPTLIEWDTDIPALEILLDEASKAQTILTEHRDALAV